MKFYRLSNHFSNKDTTIIVNGSNTYIHNGCQIFDRNEVPEEEWQQVLDAIGDKQFEVDSECAFFYCKDISDDAGMKQVIIDSKNSYYAHQYCENEHLHNTKYYDIM